MIQHIWILCPVLNCIRSKYEKCCSTLNDFILEFNLALEAMIGRDVEGYMCHQCGKRMQQKDKIKRHVEVHLSLALPCSICGKVLKTRNALAQHYSSTHGQTVSYTNVI